MKSIILIILFCSAVITVGAQTKAIAYKSHSGSAANYAIALDIDNGLKYDAGFGLPSHRNYRFVKEVHYLKENTIVIYSAMYQGDFIQVKDTVFVRNFYDTIVDKQLLVAPISIDTLRVKLAEKYRFDNSFKEAKFMGFGKVITKNERKGNKKKKNAVTIITSNQPNKNLPKSILASEQRTGDISQAFLPKKSFSLSFSLFFQLLFVSGIIGWLAWKLYQPLYKHTV